MFLGYFEIRKLIEKKRLIIEPYTPGILSECGINLRIGNEYAVASKSYRVNVCEFDPESIFLIHRNVDKIVIPPRGFVLVTTLEYIKLPNDVIGLCNLRSTLARWGLSIPPTVVDAGFEGNLTIEVINNTENIVEIPVGTKFLHLVLAKIKGAKPYSGSYKGQKGVKLPKKLKGE